MSDNLDLRSESQKRPGQYKCHRLGNGEFRNVYRREDGTERLGCWWRDREAARLGRETLPGETFVEVRDARGKPTDASAPGA